MNYRFNEGETFIYDDEEVEIVEIDNEDDEFPYECWPVKIVKQAKEIDENQSEDDEFAYCGYYDVLTSKFIDERICLSDYDIECCKHSETKKKLKEKQNIVKIVLKDSDGDWDEDIEFFVINPDEKKLNNLLNKKLNMDDPADYIEDYIKKNFTVIDVKTYEINC